MHQDPWNKGFLVLSLGDDAFDCAEGANTPLAKSPFRRPSSRKNNPLLLGFLKSYCLRIELLDLPKGVELSCAASIRPYPST